MNRITAANALCKLGFEENNSPKLKYISMCSLFGNEHVGSSELGNELIDFNLVEYCKNLLSAGNKNDI